MPRLKKEVSEELPEDFPEVAGNGLFQVVKIEGGFVLYNPHGQRTSELLDENKANDLARANNLAAHLKPVKR